MKIMLPKTLYNSVIQNENRFNASLVATTMRNRHFFQADSLEFDRPILTRATSNLFFAGGYVLLFVLAISGIVYKFNTTNFLDSGAKANYEMVDGAAYDEQNSPARIKSKHQHRSVSVFEELEEDLDV
jgi:hypothetical protein